MTDNVERLAEKLVECPFCWSTDAEQEAARWLDEQGVMEKWTVNNALDWSCSAGIKAERQRVEQIVKRHMGFRVLEGSGLHDQGPGRCRLCDAYDSVRDAILAEIEGGNHGHDNKHGHVTEPRHLSTNGGGDPDSQINGVITGSTPAAGDPSPEPPEEPYPYTRGAMDMKKVHDATPKRDSVAECRDLADEHEKLGDRALSVIVLRRAADEIAALRERYVRISLENEELRNSRKNLSESRQEIRAENKRLNGTIADMHGRWSKDTAALAEARKAEV